MTFLEQIVHQLREEFGETIADQCLVVPTRRAVVFLKQAFAQIYQQTMWMPHIVSIQDFVRSLSGWHFPETLPLVFELYQVYLKRMQVGTPDWSEPFEQFYSWGEMLLKDFDEVDKYLVDAHQLFTNIKDLKEIDEFFSLPPEDLEPVRRFWETLRGEDRDLTEVQQEFLHIWQTLHEIYQGFRETLSQKKQAYDGMAYRTLVGQLERSELDIPWPKVIFVGFNALSKAEERMIELLLKARRAIVYWDVDRVYFTPPADRRGAGKTKWADQGHLAGEEAGKFIKEYHDKWASLESRLIIHDMAATHKELIVSGVALQVGQARYLGNLLENRSPTPAEAAQYAIVLADESMLFPVLYSLPDQVEKLNITMGFPLRQTNIYHLLMALLRLLTHTRMDSQGQRVFAYQDLADLLNNPYLKARAPQLSEHIQQEIKSKNLVFVSQRFLKTHELSPFLTHLFHPPETPEGLLPDLAPVLSYLAQVFDQLIDAAQERHETLEAEYIYQFATYYRQLQDMLLAYQPKLTLRGLINLIRESLNRARIPFEGEPLEGVQLMGFLETRVLDFKHLYILGANEGNLPDTSTGNSFIPYNLRKGFGLPTYEEKDAIYAYHFFRLIQRAETVQLVYNTEVQDRGSTKEISRFIRQIRYFFRDHPHLHVQDQLITTPAPYSAPAEITVSPDQTSRQILAKRYLAQFGKPTSYLSATAMTTYLGCTLRFYYRYIANIKEPEEVEENIAANTFGSILHRAMELLYTPLLKRPISPEDLKSRQEQVWPILKQAFDEAELPWGAELRGMNYLYREVIQQQIKRIIQADMQSEPFQVVSLEEEGKFYTEFDAPVGRIKLSGMLDRVDYLPERKLIRILDYKTGRVNLKDHIDLDECFQDAKYKEVFQGYFYAWLYRRQFPTASMQVGYYTVRALGEGIRFINQGQPIPNAVLDAYEDRLATLIETMFTQPFTQTEDETKCQVCPYNAICYRAKR